MKARNENDINYKLIVEVMCRQVISRLAVLGGRRISLFWGPGPLNHVGRYQRG
jgi:hypothetical protein